LDPNLADSYNNRAAVFLNTGLIEKAINDLNRSIQLDPEFGLAFANRAVAYRLIDNVEMFENDLDMAVILGVEREAILSTISQFMDAVQR